MERRSRRLAITILEGSTFCIDDERPRRLADERLLHRDHASSILRLSINGRRPLLLSSGKVDYFSAAFFETVRPTDWTGRGLGDPRALRRRGDAGPAHRPEPGRWPVAFDLALEVASDFADIFAVKDYDFARRCHDPLPPLVEVRFDAENNQFLLADETGIPARRR